MRRTYLHNLTVARPAPLYAIVEQGTIGYGPQGSGSLQAAGRRLTEWREGGEVIKVAGRPLQIRPGLVYRWDAHRRETLGLLETQPEWYVPGVTYYQGEHMLDPRRCWEEAAEWAAAQLQVLDGDWLFWSPKPDLDPRPEIHETGQTFKNHGWRPPWTEAEWTCVVQAFWQRVLKIVPPDVELFSAMEPTHYAVRKATDLREEVSFGAAWI